MFACQSPSCSPYLFHSFCEDWMFLLLLSPLGHCSLPGSLAWRTQAMYALSLSASHKKPAPSCRDEDECVSESLLIAVQPGSRITIP